jgi:long-chain acyl-CoA synthetase
MPQNINMDAYHHLIENFNQPSIGTPILGMDVNIINSENKILPEMEEGQIVVRGSSVMLGYWAGDIKMVSNNHSNWLKTGDLGYFTIYNNMKYFFISGRLKEIIIRQGENISPTNIERQLKNLWFFGECIVFGFKNIHVGEEVAMWIDLKHTQVENIQSLKSAILNEIRANLAFSMQPKIVIAKNISNARTSVGKVRKNILSQHLSKYHNFYFHQYHSTVVEIN